MMLWDWDMVQDVIWGNESFRSIFQLGPDERISFSEYITRLYDTDKDKVLINLKRPSIKIHFPDGRIQV